MLDVFHSVLRKCVSFEVTNVIVDNSIDGAAAVAAVADPPLGSQWLMDEVMTSY